MAETNLILLSMLFLSTKAAYILNVRVHSYDNPSNTCPLCISSSRPGCCDNFSSRTCTGIDRCDNTFYYCLRDLGSRSSLNNFTNPTRCGRFDRWAKLSNTNQDAEEVDFSQSHVLGLPNPIPLRGITTGWEGVQLYVEVTDADIYSRDEFIDWFEINIEQIPIGVESTPTQYNGTFGYSSMTLSFRVDCFISHYFPNCETNGCPSNNCSCFPGYTGQECEINIDECQDAACPENSVCVDGVNSFTCQSLEESGGQNCTANYTANYTANCTANCMAEVVDNCIGVNCGERGRCVNDAGNYTCICQPGYTGNNCEIEPALNIAAGSEPSSNFHIVLCIAAVVLVTLVVAVISITQFVLIQKRNHTFLKLLKEHVEDRNDLKGSHTELAEKQTFLPQQDLHSPTGMEVESNLDFCHHHHHHHNNITNADSDDKTDDKTNGDDTEQEANAMTQNYAYNYRFVEQNHVAGSRRNHITSRPLPKPIQLASTFYNAGQAKPRNIRKIDIHKTERPQTTVTQVMALPISDPSTPAEDHCIEEGRGNCAQEEDEIATECNPGYNVPLHHMEPTTPSSATLGSRSAPTPECDAFMSVWPSNRPQRVGSSSTIHDSSPGDQPTSKSYEPFSSTTDKQSTDINSEGNASTTGTDVSILQDDDILTDRNPGYNLPMEHKAPSSQSSQANSLAPTPESEVFISVWPNNRPLREDTTETQENSLTEEKVKLALMETSV